MVVDGDFEGVGVAVEEGIFGREVESAGGSSDGAAGVRVLEGVFVGEVFVLSVGGLDDDFGRDEGRERGRAVLGEAAGVVGEGHVIFRAHLDVWFGFLKEWSW